MPAPSSLPLALYLFEHHMPSQRIDSLETKAREDNQITGLTFAERAGRKTRNQKYQLAPPATVVARIESDDSSDLSQNQGTLRRVSTIRRQKAQDDLRMSAYCWSKVLPFLPTEETGVSAFSDTTEDEELGFDAPEQSYQPTKVRLDSDSVVMWSKYVLRRMKSRYARRVRDVQLNLAWEVEEIV